MLNERFIGYIESSIKKNWEIVAFSDYMGEGFSYEQTANHILKFHHIFDKAGIKKGDKIALLGKNSSRWAIAYLSVVTYGAAIVPILPDFRPDDIHSIIEHSDSLLLFSSDTIYESLDPEKMSRVMGIISLNTFELIYSLSENIKIIFESLDKEFVKKYPYGVSIDEFILPDISNEELAVISYTSGTTGFSKGVMLSHNSLAANIRFAQNNMPLNSGDPIVSFLPLAHAYGCAFEFLFPFSIGCHVTFLTKTPSPQIVMQAFREIRPALILSVPLIIEKIYKTQIIPVINKWYIKILLVVPGINKLIYQKINHKLTNIFGGNFTEIIIGGAAFNLEAETFFKKIKLPYTVGYGMTECGPLISYASWKENRLSSSGKSVDTLEVKIDSPDQQNTVGEIILRGDNVMLGYYKNEKATKEIIDEQGWLHTGDLGLIDKEGYIFIKGRCKSLILGANGQNIYPEELEAVINNKFCISESIVVYRAEKLVALVCLDYDAIKAHNISDEELSGLLEQYRKEVNANFPAYTNISKFERFPEEFVKTPKRSIKRFLYH